MRNEERFFQEWYEVCGEGAGGKGSFIQIFISSLETWRYREYQVLADGYTGLPAQHQTLLT